MSITKGKGSTGLNEVQNLAKSERNYYHY